MKPINVGLIGLGTIGKGVYNALANNGQLIAQRTGIVLKINAVCDKDEAALSLFPEEKGVIKTTSADELINKKDIDIIVELIGGIDPAKDIILKSLNKKKHVVTANKAVLSKCWKEIFSAALEKGMLVNFEASVGGAIPIIRTLRDSFVANRINTIYGILNGTTNFILTEMGEKNCSFKDALKIAQESGIAESDPELDISGKDSAHKLAILSLLSFGVDISPENIYTEGISGIEPQDIRNAACCGYRVKLLAIAKSTDQGVEVRVHPTLIPLAHLLSDVKGADNAVFVKGDLMGDALLFGKGAGSKPTASSVISDLVEIAGQVAFPSKKRPSLYKLDYAGEEKNLIQVEELPMSCYLRFSVIDRPGVLAGISSILSEHNISIASVSQEERREGETVPVIIITHKAKEGDMRKAIAKIDARDYVSAPTVIIRIEE
ncbi:MAG: homoserine dehydrogenase [Candidatus Omnitrophota bacterium]